MEDKEEEDDGFNKKEDLRALNQRLASLINQGIVPEKALSEINKKNALNVKSIKDLYAEELSLLRARLDETAEEKVLAQRECMSLNDKCLLLQKKYKDMYKNFKSAEAETELVQSKITVMEEKLLKAEIDLGKRKCDLEKLQEKSQALATELEKASSDLDKTKKKLAQETVAKVSLMNEIQTLKEEMSFNESLHSKPTNITGWRLIQTNEHEEETIFKFRRGAIMQPAGTITIWSNESGKVPSIPTDIVMKKNHWYIGNEIKTILISSNFLNFIVPLPSTFLHVAGQMYRCRI